jgi:TRAP-type transport system periplasmic protein
VTVNIAGSEQLGNDVAMLTSLRTGALDLTANSQGAASGLVPELSALGLPFLFEDADQAFAVVDGPIGEELASKFQDLGIITLGWWDNGIRHVTTKDKAVTEPGDLNGLKIRTPADPITIDIFQALGAATEQIAFSELYVALQQGVVDGQENPLANIASSKLYEVTPHISLTAHKWESTPFLASQIGWARLTPEQQAAVQEAATEAGQLQRQLMRETDKQLLAEFQDNPDVEVHEVDREAFTEATQPVIDAWKEKEFGDFVTRVVEAAGS